METNLKIPLTLKFTETQYQHYQSGCIYLHAPDGEYLESIGYKVKLDDAKTASYHLSEQLTLTAELLSTINHDIDLSKLAIAGLADLIWRASLEQTKTEPIDLKKNL